MIDRRKSFDQLVKNNLRTSNNIRKVATGQGDDCTNSCLLDYPYFEKYYEMMVTGLRKQQAIDADPKALQQTNVTANLDRPGNTTLFFIIEEEKRTILDFSQGTVKAL